MRIIGSDYFGDALCRGDGVLVLAAATLKPLGGQGGAGVVIAEVAELGHGAFGNH